jgi:hypothetical protein
MNGGVDMATLVLGRDGMGASEAADFDLWVSFVCEHIDERVGFEVDVEERGKHDVQSDDIRTATDEEREVILTAKELLWADWCAWGCADQLHP